MAQIATANTNEFIGKCLVMASDMMKLRTQHYVWRITAK